MADGLKKITPKMPVKKSPRRDPGNGNGGSGAWIFWAVLFALFLFLANPSNTNYTAKSAQKLSYSELFSLVKDNKDTGKIVEPAIKDIQEPGKPGEPQMRKPESPEINEKNIKEPSVKVPDIRD